MILDRILEHKRQELAERQRSLPLPALQECIASQQTPLDFAAALQGEGIRLIAEVKRASPSRGLLCPNFDPVALARTYAQNGAAAISVLTDEHFFQGSLGHLSEIRKAVELPLLRKDFIFHPYQVYESRAFGADALLLIAAILSKQELKELLSLSHGLGMQCLVEVHDEEELSRAVESGAKVIGINNRDLKTFTCDLTTTQRLRPYIPPGRIAVSESGIKGRGDLEKLQEWGVDAALVGEALVTAKDVVAKMRELLPSR